MKLNKLTINQKSEYMLVSNKKNIFEDFNIRISNYQLKQNDHIKYLDVMIDNKLNWQTHIHYVNLSTLLKVYYAMAYSHLQYSVINWRALCATNINAAIISQKKLIRILTRSSYNTHTNGLFRQLKLLKLSDTVSTDFEICKTMYCIS